MPSVRVDPLVDGFMTDGQIGIPDLHTPGDEFWRPAFSDTAFDISTDTAIPEPRAFGSRRPARQTGLGFCGPSSIRTEFE